MLNPNTTEIYAGFAGVDLQYEEFDFGDGITLNKTYAHIMAPYMAAFKRAEPGKPHPTPWKAISGGFAFDIYAELHIPLSFKSQYCLDRVNTVWCFLALIRLRVCPTVVVPVISNESFSEIPEIDREPNFWPIEIGEQYPILDPKAPASIDITSLEWVRSYWITASSLLSNSESFNLAFQAADQSMWIKNPELALIALWGGLERIFLIGHQELKFRVSTAIASYLELPGEERLALYKTIKALYDARSRAAHGSKIKTHDDLQATYAVLKRVLIRIVERGHVPSQEELEGLFFGIDS